MTNFLVLTSPLVGQSCDSSDTLCCNEGAIVWPAIVSISLLLSILPSPVEANTPKNFRIPRIVALLFAKFEEEKPIPYSGSDDQRMDDWRRWFVEMAYLLKSYCKLIHETQRLSGLSLLCSVLLSFFVYW